jgi:1-acyl-sn-glycerol-3-phosphate acyltransferase
MHEEKPWRWGPLVIAKRYGFPIQPFRIRYSPLRTVAFIGEDFFVSHIWSLARTQGGITASIEFAAPVYVDNPEVDALKWWEWCRKGIVQ